MGPVHLYLAAWVAGGVLLGTSMLLDGREHDPADEPTAGLGAPDRTPPPSDSFALPGPSPHLIAKQSRGHALVRARNALPLGLVGFGLSGLTAKGLDLDHWPWSFVCALTVGLLLIALGYRLSRRRAAAPVDQQTKSA
jgi:hypothetical protein